MSSIIDHASVLQECRLGIRICDVISITMVPSGRGQTVCIDQEANQFQCMPAYSTNSVSFVRCLDAAHEAFNKAVEIFGSTITKDFTKERLQFKALQVLKTSGVR